MIGRRRNAPGPRTATVLLGYLGIVLAVLRPPWGRLGSEIAAGTEPCDTVPFALAWAIGWGTSRIDALGLGYWDAPIFHPTAGAFALSEPMPLLALVTWPAHALGVPLGGCMNLALFATLVANGWFVRSWLQRLRTGARLATLGGGIALLLPFVHQELGVMPLVALWPMVWMLRATGDLLGTRSPQRAWRAAIELGLATTASFACCGQLTLFTVLLLVPCGVCLLRRDHLRPGLLANAAVALAIAAAGILPLALPQRATLDALGLRRSDKSQNRGAARPMQLVRVPWEGIAPLPASMVAKRPEDRAFDPGPLRLVTAAVGVVLALGRRRQRRETAMLLVLVVGALGLALATRIELLGWEPSEWLADHVPGYGQIRGLFRAVVLAQLGVVALAMVGLRALQVRLRARRRASWPLFVLGTLLLVELTPPAPRWTALPQADTAWVRWLRDEAEPGAAIAWIPFAPSGEVCDHEDTARAMLLGLEHGHPLINGYSSFFPPLHNRTSQAARTLPNGRGMVALRMAEARYLIMPDHGPLDGIDEDRRKLLGIHAVLYDAEAGITVFEVEASDR